MTQRFLLCSASTGHGRNRQEDVMAKGQMKKPKEAKKPKSEKPKGEPSAYKQAQGQGKK